MAVIGPARALQAVVSEARASGTMPEPSPVARGQARIAAGNERPSQTLPAPSGNGAEVSDKARPSFRSLSFFGLSAEQRDAQLERASAHLMAGAELVRVPIAQVPLNSHEFSYPTGR